MARIRTTKPEFWQDEKLAPLDPLTRLVFLGLIGMADDCGRVLDNVKAIDAFIFPETNDSAAKALVTLASLGRIARGLTASGQRVIQIVKWEEHQKVSHPNLAAALPEIVAPSADTAPPAALRRDSGEPPAALVPLPTINDLRSTTNDQRSSAARAAEAWTADFALAWAAYPKRPNNSRGKASKAYMARRREGVSAEAILAGVVAYAAYVQAIGQPPHFVKLASTFFGPDEHWLTDYAVPESDPLAGAPPEVRACIQPNGKVRLWEDLPDGETRPTAAMQWLAGRDGSGKKVA